MLRNRLTWGETGTRQRRASAHPSTPDEGPASPAYKGKDPDADAYENGDTSSWAEDPTKGPYRNTAHPSTPDEGPASPAYKAAALERKAAKCIRLATAMLGKKATVAQIEDQALILMDLSDRAIHASLSRLGGEDQALVVPESMDDEALVKEMLKAEGMDDSSEDEAPPHEEEAPSPEEKMARLFERRISRIEAALGRSASSKTAKPTSRKASDEELLQEMLWSEGMADPPEAPEAESMDEVPSDVEGLESMLTEMMGDEDLMLGEMLVDEGMVDDLSGDSMLPGSMPAESMMPMAKEPAAPMMESAEAVEPAAEAMGEDDPMMDPMMESPLQDPMGMFEEGMDAEERAILAKIFRGAGDDAAPVKEEEEDEEEDEEEVEETPEAKAEAVKTARLRPQPKKASVGATRLGGVSKSATGNSELDELSKLWESSPDVSKYFG